ncbi:MAG: hypothetical protein IKO47_02385 [Ruminococcus sp.]|nr:hypothetical protein [Ruminococcus sp.]
MVDLTNKTVDELYNGANVPVTVAAKVMRKDPMFIRIGLQRGLLPFGVAIKKDEHGKQFDYYISPKLFYEYTGFLWDTVEVIDK